MARRQGPLLQQSALRGRPRGRTGLGFDFDPRFLSERWVNDGRSLHQGRELAASLAARTLRKH